MSHYSVLFIQVPRRKMKKGMCVVFDVLIDVIDKLC